MRPVRLEMESFASFRTATTVDFDGADRLVGPTGSGKSTVIDAMVFALFGSAPGGKCRLDLRPVRARPDR